MRSLQVGIIYGFRTLANTNSNSKSTEFELNAHCMNRNTVNSFSFLFPLFLVICSQLTPNNSNLFQFFHEDRFENLSYRESTILRENT